MVFRYALPVFLGAFLLFQVQPLIARYVLPWFGGTPSVWTTCMLFFQVLLLIGYLYAHVLISRAGTRRQAVLHGVLLLVSLGAMAAMAASWGTPIIPSDNWKPEGSGMPIARIIIILTVAVGLPYLVLSTTSPLLQAWFSRTHPGTSPYRLYMLSNTGSLLALLSYPVIVEPALALKAQATAWSWGYVLFVGAYAYCAWRVWPLGAGESAASMEKPDAPAQPITAKRAFAWVALPALASVMLLAETNQMCQEVAVIPFLWILPLSLYLLSFVICFDNEKRYWRGVYVSALVVLIPAILIVTWKVDLVSVPVEIALHALALFVCCMVCHGELVTLKPDPSRLTAFYLAVSVGGAFGGVFVALIAPFVAPWYWELKVGLYVCWAMGIIVMGRHETVWPPLLRQIAIAITALVLCAPFIPARNVGDGSVSSTLATSRNFYGVLKVIHYQAAQPDESVNLMIHGKTMHGYQYASKARSGETTAYYVPTSGAALAILNHPRRLAGEPLNIGVVGLGTGALAAYANAGDRMVFYEINPEVVRHAQDPAMFTFLPDCKGDLEVVLGDGRIALEHELKAGSREYDILVVDAFSSDSIPAHLLTREAFKLYRQHLRDEQSIIAVHVSNKSLDIPPVVWGIADSLGLDANLLETYVEDRWVGAEIMWILASSRGDIFEQPDIASAISRREKTATARVWTDDYHNLFQILK